jgi:hypothetical protein
LKRRNLNSFFAGNADGTPALPVSGKANDSADGLFLLRGKRKISDEALSIPANNWKEYARLQ